MIARAQNVITRSRSIDPRRAETYDVALVGKGRREHCKDAALTA